MAEAAARDWLPESLTALVRQRAELLDEPRVRLVALQFWSTLGLDEGATMTRQMYREVHSRLAAVLAPELVGTRLLDEAIATDWAADLSHETGFLAQSGLLSFDSFLEGMLSLADMWAGTVNAVEYAGLFAELFTRISEPALEDSGAPVVVPPLVVGGEPPSLGEWLAAAAALHSFAGVYARFAVSLLPLR